MMKNFTQKMMASVAMMFLIGSSLSAQYAMTVNSPASIAGEYEIVPGTIGVQNFAPVTGDVIIGEDGQAIDGNGDGTPGTVLDGCETLTTVATGKIVFLDRGECSFFVKGNAAQAAGAIALIVCNNTGAAPTVMGLGANGEGADITIPCVMASRANCNILKMSLASGAVNVTLGKVTKECEATYDNIVFWGEVEGQGDFTNGFGDWTSINIEPLDRDDVQWVISEDGLPEESRFFGGTKFMDSPTGCSSIASFSAVKYSLADNPNPGSPPYPTYSAELISPSIDCTGKDSIVLEFYALYNNLNNDASSVSVSFDGGMTWESIGLLANLSANTLQDILETERIRIPVPQFSNKADCKIKFTAAQDFYYLAIDDVTLRSGTFRDVRANNFLSGAQNYLAPKNQPSEIPFLIDVQNLGNSAVEISAKAEVLKGNTVIHTQTQNFGVVMPGATYENSPFAETFTPPAEAGTYTIRYTVSSNIGDDDTANNVRSTDFVLEDDGMVMSKLPIDYDNVGGWGIGGQSNRSYGAYYKFPSSKYANGDLYTVESISAGISQDEDSPALEGFLIGEIFTWDDLNGDLAVDPDERTKIGEGRTIILADGTVTFDLTDVNDPDAQVVLNINNGDAILAMIHQNSLNQGVTWRAFAISTGDRYSTTATDLAFDTIGRADASFTPNFCGFEATGSSPDDIDSRIYNRSGQLTYYVPINLGRMPGTAVNDFDASISFNVFPNPTANKLNIDLNFEEAVDYAVVSILDNTGKYIRGMKFDNVTNRSTSMDVSALTNGVYTLQVQTPNGFSTKQFAVQK